MTLTPEEIQKIRDRADSIPQETKIAWLKKQASKGDERAKKALDRIKIAVTPPDDSH